MQMALEDERERCIQDIQHYLTYRVTKKSIVIVSMSFPRRLGRRAWSGGAGYTPSDGGKQYNWNKREKFVSLVQALIHQNLKKQIATGESEELKAGQMKKVIYKSAQGRVARPCA